MTKVWFKKTTGSIAVFEEDASIEDWPDFQETVPDLPLSASQALSERDRLLFVTDWWAASDRTMTAEQTAYRQALRDITDQAGFPADITWPTKPE
jgi:hypothetical protein